MIFSTPLVTNTLFPTLAYVSVHSSCYNKTPEAGWPPWTSCYSSTTAGNLLFKASTQMLRYQRGSFSLLLQAFPQLLPLQWALPWPTYLKLVIAHPRYSLPLLYYNPYHQLTYYASYSFIVYLPTIESKLHKGGDPILFTAVFPVLRTVPATDVQ